MKFSIFFNLLKKYLADGATTPEFFRELIEMITDDEAADIISASEITFEKTDETLRSYSKRGPSKRMARQIVYRIRSENMIESINSRPNDTLKLLTDEFSKYLVDVNSNNIGEKITECFVNLIRDRAGIIPTSNHKKKDLIALSYQLKEQFGQSLLMETNYHCAFIGCDKDLIITNNGVSKENYEVSKIEGDKDADLKNLIALCPDCFVSYQGETLKKITHSLKQVKKLLISNQNSKRSITETKLDEGLISVLTSLSKLKFDEFDITLTPQDITNKISPEKNRILYNTVKNNVIDNFVTVDRIIINLDKQGKIDYEEIQSQMRSIYKKLKKNKSDNLTIFNTIVEKIQKTTMQDLYYCQTIVSYFIQKCEVLE